MRQPPIKINPKILKWARERAWLSEEDIAHKMSIKVQRIGTWESIGSILTYKQSCDFARITRIPFGYLFLDEPVEDDLGIADFRSISKRGNAGVSVDLLDVVNTARFQQDWYRKYIIQKSGGTTLSCFQKNYKEEVDTAQQIREFFQWDNLQFKARGSSDFLRACVSSARDKGVLVSRSGIVRGNTSRALDTNEFRGFAIFDEYAPLIFINSSKESYGAQIFTLAHELAHLFRKESGVDSLKLDMNDDNRQSEEAICNRIAANALMPAEMFDKEWKSARGDVRERTKVVSDLFKVSKMATIIRAFQRKCVSRSDLHEILTEEKAQHIKHLEDRRSKGNKGGGDYYNALFCRLPAGEKFAKAVITSAEDGNLRYTDAFNLLTASQKVFDKCATKLLGL